MQKILNCKLNLDFYLNFEKILNQNALNQILTPIWINHVFFIQFFKGKGRTGVLLLKSNEIIKAKIHRLQEMSVLS